MSALSNIIRCRASLEGFGFFGDEGDSFRLYGYTGVTLWIWKDQ